MAAFPPPPPPPAVAAAVVRGSAVYILAGALAKVFWGSPSDLPVALLEAMWWDTDGLFKLVIAIELIAAVVGLLSPKLGWPAVGAVVMGFILVLLQQLLLGQTSCGCFGPVVAVPIWVMMPVDVLVLAGFVAVRPWSSLQSSPWRLWSLAPPPFAVVAALWYVHAAMSISDPSPQQQPAGAASVNAESASTRPASPAAGDRGTTTALDRDPDNPASAKPTTDVAASDTGWRLPARFPRYVILRPTRWIGRPLAETSLATWADVGRFPPNATLIFYYDTCDHCAAHLKELAAHPDDPTKYVLIQLPTPPNSRYPMVIDETPPGMHVKLPAGPKWQIQTPWDVIVSNGIVIDAIKGF